MSAAIAFVDIRGSTALAESLPPTEFSALLSLFRRGVSLAAKRSGGLVDKFVGDGALVVFGAPDEDAQACAKALAFARDLASYLAVARSVRPLDVGIGIHHGRVFCGVVGDRDRLEFTVLGDAVNVASRLEAMTRTTGHRLLISGTVLRGADEPVEAWETIGERPLRGRREPVAVYGERRGKGVAVATPCPEAILR
jgi:adenylate cyclase